MPLSLRAKNTLKTKYVNKMKTSHSRYFVTCVIYKKEIYNFFEVFVLVFGQTVILNDSSLLQKQN